MENKIKKSKTSKNSNSENVMKKSPFYIFLDLDTALWDEKFAGKTYGESYYNFVQIPKLKSSSVDALNNLLFSLEGNHNTYLVVLSKNCRDSKLCAEYLYENGLKYKKPIYLMSYNSVTPVAPLSEKMENFMLSHKPQNSIVSFRQKSSKLLSRVGDIDLSKNFVLIDGNKSFNDNAIPNKNTIKINHREASLTQKQVNSFLKYLNIDSKMLPNEKPKIEK